MAITGTRSDYPERLDDWGLAYENNVGQRFRAARWNEIQDGLYALEEHTRRILLTGSADSLRTDTGDERPQLLVKTFVVTVPGPAAETQTVDLPEFTDEELALFGGSPLAAGYNIHPHVRKIKSGNEHGSYLIALKSPADADGSSQQLTIAPLRDYAGDTNFQVPAGDYIVTLLITR